MTQEQRALRSTYGIEDAFFPRTVGYSTMFIIAVKAQPIEKSLNEMLFPNMFRYNQCISM